MLALFLTFVASSAFAQVTPPLLQLPDGSWIDPLVVTGVIINDTHVGIDFKVGASIVEHDLTMADAAQAKLKAAELSAAVNAARAKQSQNQCAKRKGG
jgi:hypothetical protein